MDIKRFNEMEKFIKTLVSARKEFPLLTENIKLLYDDSKPYHFSNECDMINRIVIGMSAKQFRLEHSIEKGESIRPYLTEEQININGNTNDLNGNMLPLCPNGIGGILLFSDTIEENPDRYYATSANPCVGYASNDVNATTNIMRGSMNLTETKRLDNGYRFVWDFTTSQANGTISCVALTHKWAELAYMGDTYNGTGFVWTMRSRNGESSGQARTAYINAVEIDLENNFLWTIGINKANELIIQKVRASFTSIGFLATPYLATINNLETSVIKTADKTMKITYTIQEE